MIFAQPHVDFTYDDNVQTAYPRITIFKQPLILRILKGIDIHNRFFDFCSADHNFGVKEMITLEYTGTAWELSELFNWPPKEDWEK